MTNNEFNNRFNKDNRLAKNYITQLLGGKDNRDDRRFFKSNFKCSLCDTIITDARNSHNALPLSDSRCCADCNAEKVLPARLEVMSMSE